AVLAVGGNLLQGAVPKVHEDPSEAVAFYLGEPARISIGMVVALLGVVVLLWFLGVLRDRLFVAEQGAGRLAHAAFAGGIVGSALLAAGLAQHRVRDSRAGRSGGLGPPAAVSAADRRHRHRPGPHVDVRDVGPGLTARILELLDGMLCALDRQARLVPS
ncbi:MAG: hypothetical protein ACRDV2_04990, partial [Actinomycetes bacterium]